MRLLVAISVLLAEHASGAPDVIHGKARIDLKVRKPKALLGENTQLDFCVVNTGKSKIQIDVGGDYRGSSRSLRYRVEVRDAKGALMPDPDPTPFNMGGISHTPEIAPGKRWCDSLPLARYARIEAAGRYVITATHDLGWPAKAAPIGKVMLELAMPTAAQAEQVIAEMEKLPDDPNTSSGEISAPYADWSALAHEPYVAPLEQRARQGNVRAITGLASIPTQNATRALVRLLDHATSTIARGAAQGLAMRLPDPALTGQLGPRNPFENSLSEQRKYLSTKSWVPALADDVRAAARKRLAKADVEDQRDGAFMLEAVGTVADGPDLVKALDVAIDRTRTVPAETNVYPVPRGAVMELMRAARILVARGLTAPAAPAKPGELAIWLVALQTGARPASWETTLGAAMQHATAYVRELAMQHAPDPIPAAHVPLIAKNLAHADLDVQVAAASLAERGKLLALGPDVVKAMKRATGLRLNILGTAANALGQRYERVQMLIARLADKDVFDEVLRELLGTLQSSGSSSSGKATDAQRATVIAAWQKFAPAVRKEIEAGTRLALTDPRVTKHLIPPNWKLTGANGGPWP
jgi:hypothetical protein